MRDRRLVLAVLTITLLVTVSACGSVATGGEPLAAADEGATEDGAAASIDDPLPTSADPCTEPVDFSAIASDLTGDGYPTGLRFL